MAGQGSRRRRAAADPDRPAQPGQVSDQRHRPQCRRLVQGVQRAARRQALSAAGATGPHLVIARLGRESMMRLRHILLIGGIAVMLAAPGSSQAPAKPVYGDWGYDASAMDRSVKPGDDFFAFVNGTWFNKAEIAPDRTFVGIDSVLNDQIEKDVRAIVEDMAKDPSANGRLGQQIGDLYASWMDEGRIEQLGTEPLKPYLARVAAAKTRGDLVDLFAEPGFDSPVGIAIFPDLKNPSRYAVYTGQGGLGMPNRDYYLLKGEKYDAYR